MSNSTALKTLPREAAVPAVTQPVAPAKASALVAMAARYSVEPEKMYSTLAATAFKGATPEQMMALVIVANEFGLNPFTKEIYAFPDKGGGIVPVIGIDGWLRRINEHAAYDGMECADNRQDGKLVSVTCSIWRKDRSRPTVVTEYLDECKRNTDPWNKCPSRMLRHRATIQCARVAFGFSGGDEDEAAAVRERDVTPKARVPAPALFDAPKAQQALPPAEDEPALPLNDDRKTALAVLLEKVPASARGEFFTKMDHAGLLHGSKAETLEELEEEFAQAGLAMLEGGGE